MSPIVVGLICFAYRKKPDLAENIGVASIVVAASISLFVSAMTLFGETSISISLPSNIPFASISLGMDKLSAFFMIPISVVFIVASIYGKNYLRNDWNESGRGSHWLFMNVLFSSMASVVAARNGVLFVVAWEIMAVSSFALVMYEHEKEGTVTAGWIYASASKFGGAALLALFVILGWSSKTLDFTSFSVPIGFPVGALFALALVGFGTKAGLVPAHVWLPEAHPAAPSHVSALMSGVMIKTGVYGILRMLTFLGPPDAWWGWSLIIVGSVTGVGGILYATAQKDIKRALAYSSIENMGVISIGLGLGMLGLSSGSSTAAFLGFAGAMLHVWNHAIMKSLLFMCAGSIIHGAGSRNIERMGGLLKTMRTTGAAFLVGSAAISGLPILNGFAGEFMILWGGYEGISGTGAGSIHTAGLFAVTSIALISGIAVACFTKLFGIVFLGEPRSREAAEAHESGSGIIYPLVFMAIMCAILGMLSPLLAPVVGRTLAASGLIDIVELDAIVSVAVNALTKIRNTTLILTAIVIAVLRLKTMLPRGKEIDSSVTWDCGYAAPTAKMQYTAMSFANPVVQFVKHILDIRIETNAPNGLFPTGGDVETKADDVVSERLFRPIVSVFDWTALNLRWLQQGRNQLYILYIALTLMALLFWKLG